MSKKVITKRIRRAVLFGPLIPNLAWVSRKIREHKLVGTDLRIGVDGGTRFWSGLNIPPEIIVGDWDSLGSDPMADPNNHEAQVLTLPKKKNGSDLYYTLEVLKKTEIKDILCLGFTGGRPDHHLSNLMELGFYAQGRHSQKVTAVGPEGEYYWVSPSAPLELGPQQVKKGQTLSLFAWNQAAEGVELQGLEYGLKPGVKKIAPSSYGLSNVVKRDTVRISVKKGLLIVIVPRSSDK